MWVRVYVFGCLCSSSVLCLFYSRWVGFWSAASAPIGSCLLGRSVSGDSLPCGLTKKRWIVGVGPRGGTQEVKEAVRIEVH